MASTEVLPIQTCGPCIRNERDFDWASDDAQAAVDYMLIHASEANPNMDDVDFTQRATDLIRNSDTDKSRRNAALSMCARKIGRGECSVWMLDEVKVEIIAR